jgi:ribosomal protein L7Ae-like RNA K-turn-binding protein
MDKFYQMIGLANRAGHCVTGEDNLISHIRNNKVKLVIVSTEASLNTKKLYNDKCKFYHVQCLEVGDIYSLSQALGKSNRVAVGISDAGFTKGLLAKLTNKE